MRLVSWLVVGCIGVGAAYGAYATLGNRPAETSATATPQRPVPVEAAAVRSDRLSLSLSSVGTLLANESLMLRPEITGRVEAIHVTEGSTVKKGELLVSIDDRVFAAELKQAEAELNLARTNYARAKLLKEKGAGTVSNFDTMAANLNVTEAKVELARATLDKTKIIAPFDGVMGLKHISPGDYVNPGQDIATFQSKNPMKAEFTLPESATRRVATGQSIDLTVDALPGRTFRGTVYAIDAKIDETNRNITLRAFVPNDDDVLKPGMFARVTIITAEKADALFVPESAIVPRGNDSFVLKVNPDRTTTSTAVTLGERKNGDVEIISGLAAGDIVVTAGHLKVREGQRVDYQLAGEGNVP